MKLKSKILIFTLGIFTILCVYSFSKIKSEFSPNSYIHLDNLKNNFNRSLNVPSQYDDYIGIISSYTANSLNRDSSYLVQVSGKISENGIPINAGPLQVGDRIINVGADNLYNYTYSVSDGKALFGSSINVELSDSSSQMQKLFNKTIIVPREIFPSTMALPGSTVDRTQDYHLNWAPDPNNQYQKVQIQISYFKGISQFNSVGMPNSINSLVYNVTDNGSFVVPQTDLTRFPKGSYVEISISRAFLDGSSGNIDYIAITEAHTLPLLVIEADILNLSIDGPEIVCDSSNFNFNGLPPGCSVSWSVSPAGIATITSNGSIASIHRISSGTLTITATLDGGCSNVSISKQIILGSPKIGSAGTYNSPTNSHEIMVPMGHWDLTTFNAACIAFETNISVPSGTTIQWLGPTGSDVYWSQSGDNVFCSFTEVGQTIVLSALATNSCGTTSTGYRFKCTTTTSCGIQPLRVVISPNPAKTNMNVSLVQNNKTSVRQSFQKIRIINKMGSVKQNNQYNAGTKSVSVNISLLPPDVYTIQVFDGNTWYSEQFIKN